MCLAGAPQDEAGLRRKFETSHVCGATCRTTPIFRSALDNNPMPGHLFEGNPVGEGTTRRGTDTPVHHPEKPAGSTHSSTRGLRLPEQLERQPEFHSSDKTRHDSPVPTLQGPCSRSQNRRGSLRFLPPLPPPRRELRAWCLWGSAGDRWPGQGSGVPPCESWMGPAVGCCHFVTLNGPFLPPGKC